MTKHNETEWIRASEVASRIGQTGCTKTTIGMLARDGFLTRDEANKTYPWPQVKAEYFIAKESKNKIQPSIREAQVQVTEDDIDNLFTTEKLINMIEEGVKGADAKAYQWARALNEIIKARQGQLKLREAEGKTLDIGDVEKWVFDTSRQNKEFWMQWPDRIAVKMAEELEIDSRKLCATLKKYVRNNLDKVATMPDGYESEAMGSSQRSAGASS